MKKVVYVLLVMSFLIMVLNVALLINYTGYASSDSEGGTVGLTINAQSEESEEEAAVVSVAPSKGSGGKSSAVRRDFSVIPGVIKVLLKKDESFKKSIVIKNTEKVGQSFDLEVSESLKNFVVLSDYSFAVEPGQEKEVFVTFVTSEDTEPSVYTGKIVVRTSSKRREVNIVASLISKVVLFDVSLDVSAEYREISPGGDLLFQLTLFNLGEVGKTNVTLEYIVKDFEGNVIFNEIEVVSVETQISFSKSINIPKNVKPGEYVAIVQARYFSSLGSSSVIFHVAEKKVDLISKYKYIIIALVILLIILFLLVGIYEIRKFRKELKRDVKRYNQKIKQKKVKRKVKRRSRDREFIMEKVSNIPGKLLALEKGFKGGYISGKSYKSGKERLKKLERK